MATQQEIDDQLKQSKKACRELREEIKEYKIREKLYRERLENWAEKTQSLNNKISNMTLDDVAKMHKAKEEQVDKYLKDKEVTEAFDKQTQVKLNSEGINHGNTD